MDVVMVRFLPFGFVAGHLAACRGLFCLSAIAVGSMSAFASSQGASAEIFFSSGDVVFAEMAGSALSMQPGDPVSVHRGIGNRDVVVARGSVFRVRDEHVTVTITSGSARAGDRIEPWDGVAVVAAAGARDAPTSSAADVTVSAVAVPDAAVPYVLPASDAGAEPKKILLFDIIGAPRILRDEFNRSFAEALMRPADEGVPAASPAMYRSIVMRAAGWREKEPSRTEIREGARHRSADLVLLPVYIRSPEGDSVAVRVYNGKTGRPTGYSAQRIKPFSRLEYRTDRRRVGDLELVERYENLWPEPSTVYFAADGGLNVEAMEERFLLSEGNSRFLGAGSARPPGRHMRVEVKGVTYDITTEMKSDGSGGRVVISRSGQPLFASDYSSAPALAVRGSDIAVLAGSTLEVLRIIP